MSINLDKESKTSKKLPTVNGVVDWDKVAGNYFDYILSPYAPEMVEDCANGMSRNLLLNYIYFMPQHEINNIRVLDMGCGPGNLITHVAGKFERLVGVDQSAAALDIAKRKAQSCSVNFSSIHGDVVDLEDSLKFDLIISVNSILPENRSDVLAIFHKLANLLTDNGKLLAILPSFDTTQYLKSLRESNSSVNNSSDRSDIDTLAYADDGTHMQCYHTSTSILNETKLSGLSLEGLPEKIYYPWDLCRRYGYGYFPEASEEIWDWFIVAQKAK